VVDLDNGSCLDFLTILDWLSMGMHKDVHKTTLNVHFQNCATQRVVASRASIHSDVHQAVIHVQFTFAQNMNEFMNYRSNAFKHNTGWPDELQIEIPADYAAQFVDSCNLADLQVNIIKPSQKIKTTTVCLLATQAASTF